LDRTLRKPPLDDEGHRVRSGPVDMGTGKHSHWRFSVPPLQAW
jgi:hypothetical protein